MKFRSQHPPPPRAASRPLASGGGRGSRSEAGDSRQDSGLDSEWPSGFADTGSSFGHIDASHEVGLWGRPRRTAAGPVESWHDSSYVLQRGLEVRELSAREWNVCVSATTPGAASGSGLGLGSTTSSSAPGTAPRRRGDGADGA